MWAPQGKGKFPNNIWLGRGNQQIPTTAEKYGLYKNSSDYEQYGGDN
jgi:hypothetical protein